MQLQLEYREWKKKYDTFFEEYNNDEKNADYLKLKRKREFFHDVQVGIGHEDNDHR